MYYVLQDILIVVSDPFQDLFLIKFVIVGSWCKHSFILRMFKKGSEYKDEKLIFVNKY